MTSIVISNHLSCLSGKQSELMYSDLHGWCSCVGLPLKKSALFGLQPSVETCPSVSTWSCVVSTETSFALLVL